MALYEEPERPQDAAGYLKINFAGHGELVSELDTAKSENGALKQKMETLEKDLGAVKKENRQLKPKMDNQVETFLQNFFAFACYKTELNLKEIKFARALEFGYAPTRPHTR